MGGHSITPYATGRHPSPPCCRSPLAALALILALVGPPNANGSDISDLERRFAALPHLSSIRDQESTHHRQVELHQRQTAAFEREEQVQVETFTSEASALKRREAELDRQRARIDDERDARRRDNLIDEYNRLARAFNRDMEAHNRAIESYDRERERKISALNTQIDRLDAERRTLNERIRQWQKAHEEEWDLALWIDINTQWAESRRRDPRHLSVRRLHSLRERMMERARQEQRQADHPKILVSITLPQGVVTQLELDTGATLITLSPRVASAAEISYSDARTTTSKVANGAHMTSPLADVTAVTIQGRTLTNIQAAINPELNAGIDGLLGRNVLNHFNYEVRKLDGIPHLRITGPAK